MQDLLTPIAGIPGVAGAALFDDDDRCVAAALHPPLDEALIERAMRTLRQALVVLNVSFDSETTWSGLFLRCEGGHVIVKRVEGHTVLVVGEPSLNVAMINVGLNVAAMSLRGGRLGRGTEPRGLLGPRPGQGSQPIPAQTPPPGDFLDPRAARTVGYSSGSSGGAEVAAASVVPRATLELVLRALARHLGPAARAVIQAELVAIGVVPQAVPLACYSDLIDQVARHIPEAGGRTAFLIEAELAGIHAR